jgi:dTDP-4-amino-4,6-dideoxygalactose transaminase
MFRDHGSREKYHHEVMGVNARLDELQAAVLNIKMPYLEQWNAARQAHAEAYNEQLRDIVEAVPIVKPWATHVYCYYVIRVPERDAFRLAMEQEGIGTTIHYPIPIHLQQAAAHYGYTRGSLPYTEALAERIISLPMYPEMTEEQRQLVVSAVKKHVVSNVVKVR